MKTNLKNLKVIKYKVNRILKKNHFQSKILRCKITMKKMIIVRKSNRYIQKRKLICLYLKSNLIHHLLNLYLRIIMKMKKAHPNNRMMTIESPKI